MISFGLVLCGCAENNMTKKDPFFEKWSTMAEQSQGHSPTPRARTIEMPPLTPGEEAAAESLAQKEKPLPNRRVTLKMHNVDINVILRAMAQAANVNILIKSGVKGESSIHISNQPWDEAFRGILRTNGLSYAWEGEIIRVMTVEDMEQDIKVEVARERRRGQKLVTMVVNVDYADAGKLKESVKEFLSKERDGKTRGSVTIDEHTNSLIIQATRDDLDRIIPMLSKLDKPASQIMIRANIVETSKDTARALGIQWGGMYNNVINSRNYFVTPGGSGGSTTSNPLAGAYTPVFGSTGIAGQGFGMNFPVSSTAISAAGGVGSLGLIFGTIGGSVLEMQLQALQKDGRLNILSSPSITTLDNQTAYTENGERVPYVATSTTGGQVTQEVKFEDAVLRLEITPHVIDGKNLKMKIRVKKDEVDTTRNVQGNPYIIKKTTETILIVQDGETIVISGLTKQRNLTSDTGFPWLKDVPGLGWFFKSENRAESMEEVLVFITPFILKPQVLSENKEAPQAKPAPAVPEPSAPPAAAPATPPEPNATPANPAGDQPQKE